MTDWESITENIQRAMQALDKAQEASERLRTQTNIETLDEFQTEMTALSDELQVLKNIFSHESTYAADGLVDVLSEFFSGEPSRFRHIARFEHQPEKSE